jgi:uncharacterized SAM-binding protein YcdF (DUF218 family)
MGNQVVETLAAACRLAKRFPETALLLSGGVGHATLLLERNLRASRFATLNGLRETGMAEAKMASAVAQEGFGIATERLLVEGRSANGGENARFGLEILRDAGLAAGTVVIVQDPAMERRALLTWMREVEAAGMPLRVMSHAAFVPRVETGPGGGLRFVDGQGEGSWTVERLLGLILGEMERLHDDEQGYGPRGRGFLPHVDIPEAVWEAYQRVKAGPAGAMAER